MTEEADHIAARGPRIIVEWAVLSDGTMPAKEFFRELPKRTKAIFGASFLQLANTGKILQKRKFNREEGRFWAFKADTPEGRMVRFPCFRVKNRWIITHGFFKPAQSRWPASEIPRATKICDEHLARDSS